MEKNIKTVKEIDGKFLVGKKIFYSKAAAFNFIEGASFEKTTMSTGTKIIITYVIGMVVLFLLNGGDSINNDRRIDVAIKGGLVGGVLGLLIAPISWIKRKVTEYSKNARTNKSIDEVAYAEALQELEDGTMLKNTWAKAFSQADGDEKKAKSLYIKLRVLDKKKMKAPA